MKAALFFALASLALCGCDSIMEKRGYVRCPVGGYWMKKGTPYFGDSAVRDKEYFERTGKHHPDSYEGRQERYESIIAKYGPPPPGFFPPDPIVINTPAPAPQPSAPQPVIVVGPGSGTTIATRSSMGTVVSQFGGYQPPIGGYRPVYPQLVSYPYGY